MHERFVSEAIEPVTGTADTSRMALGEPGLPRGFVWRKRRYNVGAVLERWKESSGCRGGGREVYLRKHWYAVRSTTGEVMKIYFERQPRSKAGVRTRWWLYTVSEVDSA